jgi:Ser/Thr protein kinase RdoA (MazF antagonist)
VGHFSAAVDTREGIRRHPLRVYDELLDRWAVPRPRELSRATSGISNETWFVRSEAGEHVLRLYVHKRSEAIRLEHEIMRKVAAAD